MDGAIRALVLSVARATVELVHEKMRENPNLSPDHVCLARGMIAGEIAEATMECADEDPESEVHAIRRLAWPPQSVQEALNSGDGSYRP